MSVEQNEKIRGHKLLTDSLIARFAQVGRQEDEEDPLVIAKFFHPLSSWTWYATEYYPEDRRFFGWIFGHEKELGYFSFDELDELNVRGLPIERDLSFKECRWSQLRKLRTEAF